MVKVVCPNISSHVLADMWQFMLKTSVPRICADYENEKVAREQLLHEPNKEEEGTR